MPEVITDNLDLWTAALLTKSTAGRGSNGKLEAYGIKKLRELILELAVRGKLVSQDPSDEPASVLLERITKEKARLTLTGNDMPFTLPAKWQWEKLGSLAEIKRGVSYKKHDAQDSDFADSVALMRANNIGDGLNFDNLIYVPKNLVREDQILMTGDLVIAMSSGSADLVGKAAQVKSDIGATFGAFCGVVRPISVELWDYLGFFFRTPLYRDQTTKAGKGIGINNLNKGALENLRVVIPPLAEQHRIVAKVAELMALCDQLEHQQTHSIEAHQTLVETLLGTLTRVGSQQEFSEAWARIANYFDMLFTTEHSIDQLKQTILQLAVMGKLVPQDPNDEPASVLLEMISKEKARLVKEGTIKATKTLPAIRQTDVPFNLPNVWIWVRLGNISSKITDGDHKTPPRISSGKRLLSAKNVRDGYLDFENCDSISEEHYTKSRERCCPETGDLLIVSVGGTIGRTSLVPSDADFALVRSVALIKPLVIDSSYLKYAMDSSLLQNSIHARKRGGAQPCLYLSEIENFVFSLPPLAEQHRIVAKVDELIALCDALKARIKDAQTTQLHLADAIVEQAVVEKIVKNRDSPRL